MKSEWKTEMLGNERDQVTKLHLTYRPKHRFTKRIIIGGLPQNTTFTEDVEQLQSPAHLLPFIEAKLKETQCFNWHLIPSAVYGACNLHSPTEADRIPRRC